MQLNSRMIILSLGSCKLCNVRYFLLKQYVCAIVCVYTFAQLVGEKEIDFDLSAHN